MRRRNDVIASGPKHAGTSASRRRSAPARRAVATRRPLLAAIVVLALLGSASALTWSTLQSSAPPRHPLRVHLADLTVKAAPRVLGVHPLNVPGRGGTRILVTGRGFTAGTVVTVGGRRAHNIDVRNPDAVYATVPRGIGTVIVRAVTANGTSVPNARSQLRYHSDVLVVGDSLGIDLGWGYTVAVDAQEHVAMSDDAVGSTGLVRPDYYNWPAHLRADIAQTNPSIVEALFGTNDDQTIVTSKGTYAPGTAAWNSVYAARVRQIAAIVRQSGAVLVWVGLPRMGPQTDLDTHVVSDLISLDRSVIEKLPGAIFIDTWSTFTNSKGGYTPYVEVAPGVWELGHAPDGTHLTTAGATVIDAKVISVLRRSFTGP
jgi:hypothetical protein